MAIPDVTGQNARIAQRQLEGLGLTDIPYKRFVACGRSVCYSHCLIQLEARLADSR